MYYLLLGAAWIVPHLSAWMVRALARWLGLLAWLVAAGPRKQAMSNAIHVLGAEVLDTAAGRCRLRRVVRGMFCNVISNYLDICLLPFPKWQKYKLERSLVRNEEYLKEILSLGKGMILFSAHFGPFAHLAYWLGELGYHVTIPVENLENKQTMRLLQRLRRRSSSHVNYVPLGGSTALRALFQALRKNHVVLITADRAVIGRSVVCDFFGAPARLPIGLVDLAIRTGAPLVGAVGWYSTKTRIHAEIIPLTLALPEEDRQRPEVLHAALVNELEQVIRARPEQWIVLSKVWED